MLGMGRRAPAQLIILSALVRSPKLRTMCIAELLTSALRSAKSPFVSTLMAGVGRAMLGPSTILFSGASDECAISSENRWRHCRKYGRQRDLQVRKVGWRLTFLRSYRCEQGRKTSATECRRSQEGRSRSEMGYRFRKSHAYLRWSDISCRSLQVGFQGVQ